MALPISDEEVDRSPAPAQVQAAFATIADHHPDVAERLAAEPALRDVVVTVIAASRSLTRLLTAHPESVEVLANLHERAKVGDETDIHLWQRLEFLRIAARDLVGIDSLPTVGANLAAMADEVIAAAHRAAGDRAAGLVTVAMGKAGARELNYSSDIDVVFVGEGDARRVLDVARRCFRVDADLRPEGRDGPLVRSLTSYESYWDSWAEPWEFQALLKARPVAGPPALADAFATAAARRVWGREFGTDDLRQLRDMKARAEHVLARRAHADREIKRGPGGIRDIEFSIQLLQLVHGRADAALRVPATLDAVAELTQAGYVGDDDAHQLVAAYTFLRTVEHRLQLVDEQQVHAVPVEGPALDHLARVLGFRDDASSTAAARFEETLVHHRAVARSIHERLFFRPLLEAFTNDRPPLTEEVVETRLRALGFTDAARTRAAVVELTRGMRRSSRLMEQLLPVLLEWLSQSPNPDLGLLGLRHLATGRHRSLRMAETFRESSEAARRLCLLLGTSRLLGSFIERQPDLIDWLADDDDLSPRNGAELSVRAQQAMAIRGEDERVAALQRLRQAETVRIAAADVLGLTPEPGAVGRAMTALADAVVAAALQDSAGDVPMVAVALGRFGGSEMAYASDLDVVLVHGGRGAEDQALAEDAASRFRRSLLGTAPANQVWALDMDLRPEGKHGSLAPSLERIRRYVDGRAQTWERQAWVRARIVAGDADVAAHLGDLIDEWVWDRPFADAEAREIRRMKARVERERMPPGEDPNFHLKLGRGSLSDVEWTVQLLQLANRVPGPSTLPALEALVARGAISPDDAGVLAEAWRFCEATRDRWFLVKGGPGDSLPVQSDQLGRLARSLGTTASELRDNYRRVTRRARGVVERLFYGTA